MPAVPLRIACDQLLETVEERVKMGGVKTVGIPTGFKKLDEVTGGWRKKAMYLIASRPAMGKSSFALWSLIAAAVNGETIVLASFEMSAEMIALRTLSGLTSIPAFNIERGLLTAHELKQLNEMRGIVNDMRFLIIDDRHTSDSLVEKVTDIHLKKPINLLAVDYASLFRDDMKFGEHERLARISGNMLALCHEIDIPLILLAQLNRQSENREDHMPILSDVADSSGPEKDAFLVGFPYREQYYINQRSEDKPQEIEYNAKFIISKNRQGETGQISITFHPRLMKWSEDMPPSGALKGKVKG